MQASTATPATTLDHSKWQQEYSQVRQSMAKTVPTALHDDLLHIMRVNQLDAERMDDEIRRYLSFYFAKIFTFFDPSILDHIQPELTATLQGLIYYFSTYKDNQSFGDRMQNLKYQLHNTNGPITRTRKFVHVLLLIGVPYLWTRVTKTMSFDWNWTEQPNDSWRKRLWKFMHRTEQAFKVLNWFNFVVFLFHGKYRNLVDRLLRMRLVYNNPNMVRHVSFDYMNRELVWNGFAEVILFLVPLIPFDLLSQKLSRWFSLRQNKATIAASTPIQTDYSKQSCGICKEQIQVPFISSDCKHVYCYYCIQRALQMDANYLCVDCGEPVRAIKRLEYDDIK